MEKGAGRLPFLISHMNRLTHDGHRSRRFDMECYRVMYDLMDAFEFDRAALEGVANLFERDTDELLQWDARELSHAMDRVKLWFSRARNRLSGQGGSRMVAGHPLLSMYQALLEAHGILPSELDRQDPETFFSVLCQRAVSERDIPPHIRELYGL